MDLSKLVSSLKNELRYDYNLLTKVGPIYRDKRGNDKGRYIVRLEFSGIDEVCELINPLRCYTIEVDYAMLPLIVLGHVWTKQEVYQNPRLKRITGTLNLSVGEERIFAKPVQEVFGLPWKSEERKDYFAASSKLPLSYSGSYARCYQFKIETQEEDLKSFDYVLIPTYEVLRFLFFKTSDLVDITFNNSLSKRCEQGSLELEEGAGSRTTIILTDRKYSPEEEYTMASILYNPDYIRTYESAYSYINKVLQDPSRENSEIAAVYPKSLSTIHVCGFPIVHEGKKYFFVNQLYSAPIKQAFERLVVISSKRVTKKGEGKKRNQGERPRHLTASAPMDEIEISRKAAADDKSIQNRLDFTVETEDKFESNSIPDRIEIERPLESPSSGFHGAKTIIVHKKSGIFTLNLERSKESEWAIARLFAESNSVDHNDSFRPMLIKVLKDLRGEVYSKYFNCSINDFSYSFCTNHLGEDKNINTIAIKIFKGKKEKVLIDFSGIYSIRIVSFYREDLGVVKPLMLRKFIELVVKELKIPLHEDYLRYNIKENPFEDYRWNRLNIGSITEKGLKEKIQNLLEDS